LAYQSKKSPALLRVALEVPPIAGIPQQADIFRVGNHMCRIKVTYKWNGREPDMKWHQCIVLPRPQFMASPPNRIQERFYLNFREITRLTRDNYL
jgi:hypothetical protein